MAVTSASVIGFEGALRRSLYAIFILYSKEIIMKPLTLEQFNKHFIVIAARHGRDDIGVHFNPSVEYTVVNISRMTRDWARFNIENNPMFDDMIKLGCRTILWDGKNDWVHPYLVEPEQIEVNEVAFAGLKHMAKKRPELKWIHANTFDDSAYGYIRPIEVNEEDTFDTIVAKLAKEDSWLRFQEAYEIARAVLDLRISSFKYYKVD